MLFILFSLNVEIQSINVEKSAVSVEKVSFKYNENKILENICVKISYGKIYALLGSISWGKTTLLRLILGRIKRTQDRYVY